MNATPVLDEQGALRRLNFDKALLQRLLKTFLNQKPEYMAALLEAAKHKQWIQVEKTAHSIKGAAATVGLAQCEQLAKTVQHICVDPISTESQRNACIQRLHMHLQSLDAILEPML